MLRIIITVVIMIIVLIPLFLLYSVMPMSVGIHVLECNIHSMTLENYNIHSLMCVNALLSSC